VINVPIDRITDTIRKLRNYPNIILKTRICPLICFSPYTVFHLTSSHFSFHDPHNHLSLQTLEKSEIHNFIFIGCDSRCLFSLLQWWITFTIHKFFLLRLVNRDPQCRLLRESQFLISPENVFPLLSLSFESLNRRTLIPNLESDIQLKIEIERDLDEP
jgi:hypothetical protein